MVKSILGNKMEHNLEYKYINVFNSFAISSFAITILMMITIFGIYIYIHNQKFKDESINVNLLDTSIYLCLITIAMICISILIQNIYIITTIRNRNLDNILNTKDIIFIFLTLSINFLYLGSFIIITVFTKYSYNELNGKNVYSLLYIDNLIYILLVMIIFLILVNCVFFIFLNSESY